VWLTRAGFVALVVGAKEFPYFNKPFSIDHFAKNGQKVWDKDDIIVILDIDEAPPRQPSPSTRAPSPSVHFLTG
jgi:hypothetical protein